MIRTPLAALALALPLAACVSFGPKPPASLLTLTAAQPLAAGPATTTDDKRAVAVPVLTARPALMTQRVMVASGPTEVAYLKGGLWAAPPAQLFRTLLAETITVRTGRVVPAARDLAARPDTRVSGQLSAFGLDGPGGAAVVTFDATLTHEGQPTLAARRFTARVAVASDQPGPVAAAINQAANDVATQVADWVGR